MQLPFLLDINKKESKYFTKNLIHYNLILCRFEK